MSYTISVCWEHVSSLDLKEKFWYICDSLSQELIMYAIEQWHARITFFIKSAIGRFSTDLISLFW